MRIDQFISGEVANHLPDLLLLVGPDGAILDANSAALARYGYSRAEMLALSISDLESPHDGEPARGATPPTGEPGTPIEPEHRGSDGAAFPVEVWTVSLDIEGGTALFEVVRDVSEHKAAEEALRVSEERFRAVADFAYDWEAWNAPDGTYRYVSPSCERITGHTAAEFMADADLTVRITHPHDLAACMEHHEAAAREGQGEDLELDFRIITPVGETRWINHLCSAVYGEDGQWLGRRESNRDITDRKLAEEALGDARWRLESIIEGTHVGTWEWNVQTGVSVFNDRWAEMVGYTLDELAPTGITTEETLAHPDDLKRSDEELERHFAGEIPYYDCELRLRHKDGHWVWVQDRGRVITRTEDGKPLMMFGTHTDITERKQAEEQIETMLSLLESTMESTADAIMVADGRGRMVRFNAKFGEMWGIPEEILASQDDEAAVSFASRQLKDPQDFVRAVQELYSTPEATSLDVLEFADGRLIERYSQPQRIGDTVLGRVWSFRDITAHAQAEAELERRAQRLSQLLAERERHLEQLSSSLSSIIDVVSRVVEARDPYTAGHQRRVAELAVCISEDMGMSAQQIEEIRTAALIHDVGKMSVPAEILGKPGVLSAIERELVKAHSETGHEIISSANMEGQVAEIVYQHHERCDGSGYPRGLRGDQLLPGSDVLMVADVVEAMTSHRPYRAALGADAALAEIEQGAGTLYDSKVVKSCVRVFREQGFVFSEA